MVDSDIGVETEQVIVIDRGMEIEKLIVIYKYLLHVKSLAEYLTESKDTKQ